MALYSRLAEGETGERRQVLGLRTRLLVAAVGRFPAGRVLPLIERAERADAGMYDNRLLPARCHVHPVGRPWSAAVIRRSSRTVW